MPSKLYKYFPDTIYKRKNRSIQALENNTVYLEEVKNLMIIGEDYYADNIAKKYYWGSVAVTKEN